MREPMSDWNKEWTSCADEAAAQAAERMLPAWFAQFLSYVCELPDRNSPDDEPEAIVATLEELRNCAINAIEQCAAPTPTVAADAAAIGAAKFEKLQTFLTEHYADVRPTKDAGLAAWALAALVFARADAAQPDETCKCRRLGDWKGFHHPLCDKAHENAPASTAQPDERAAFEAIGRQFKDYFGHITPEEVCRTINGLQSNLNARAASQGAKQ